MEMVLETESLKILKHALTKLEESFSELPGFEQRPDLEKIEDVLLEVAQRMQNNYPYPHPLYAGQMLKPPHPVARLAYMLSLFINPNNHALDGGRESSEMEKEAVAQIASMLGFKSHIGHLCAGGTMANLEALWAAGKLSSGKLTVASEQAHYTHGRISEVLKLPFKAVATDEKGRMDIAALETILQEEEVGTVVATTGTTATGSVDPLNKIVELKKKYGFHLHVDAAYGGYFRLIENLETDALEAFAAIEQADSVVIDPHKHGLQPYGCGCVIFKDPAVGALYKHDSPYTYFSSDALHLGEISLECSRPGSSAVALWATQRLLPLKKEGEFAAGLSKSKEAARILASKIKNDPRFVLPLEPELDIVVFALKADKASHSSRLAKLAFEKAAEKGLHLALATIPKELFGAKAKAMEWDEDKVSCLRSCLMKPEHLDWLEKIWDELDSAVIEAVSMDKTGVPSGK